MSDLKGLTISKTYVKGAKYYDEDCEVYTEKLPNGY